MGRRASVLLAHSLESLFSTFSLLSEIKYNASYLDSCWERPNVFSRTPCTFLFSLDLLSHSGWAIGLNRSFGSVCSVLKNFGLRKTTIDWWTSKIETDVFGFRFNWLGVRFPPNFSICPCRSSAPSTLAHVSPTSQEPMKINTCVGVACHHRSSKWVGA